MEVTYKLLLGGEVERKLCWGEKCFVEFEMGWCT